MAAEAEMLEPCGPEAVASDTPKFGTPAARCLCEILRSKPAFRFGATPACGAISPPVSETGSCVPSSGPSYGCLAVYGPVKASVLWVTNRTQT